MAKVGSLGDIVFEVSDSVVRTLRDLSLSGSARLQEHERHLQKSLVEFCGSDARTLSFRLRLSRYLGVDPETSKNRIIAYTESGTAVVFVLGVNKYGDYKWLIDKYKFDVENYDGKGNITSLDAIVTLKEYAKE